MHSCGHNALGDQVRDVRMPSEMSPPPLSPLAVQRTTVLISRQQTMSTPEVARDTFDHMSERTHATVSGRLASWGHTLLG